ncbi:hypothetical protein QDR37_15860 [Amnibacterium sp. CER49]|uniref:hypothetical protein n=1 Tax=Amnibacterium sp. CER49 TaxID=3039161 RepID=UPI0024489A2C|nr:hypothetical protein [Amnibacterium sp. CER49]MDH2445422.1 hypothetical protein [Amnibacterium sp. CER49]
MRIRLLPLLTRPRRHEQVLVASAPSTPVLTGNGDVDLECWRCGFAICAGLHQVVDASNRIFRCPGCDALNRSRL